MMRLLHTSDLHIGITWNDYSLIDDQRYILEQIIEIAKKEKVDGIIIAGDIYDTPTPNEQSVHLLDWFLTEIAKVCSIYMIAGNHDSTVRVGSMRGLMRDNIHLTGTYQDTEGKAEHVVVNDEYGELNIYLMPYLRTQIIRNINNDDPAIMSPDSAFKAVMESSDVDKSQRNILVCHQYITGRELDLELSDSESFREVGTSQCVSWELLDGFDYVALGHIHKPQSVMKETIRYSGSPLSYSVSELTKKKSVTIIDIHGKDDVSLNMVPLEPKYAMVKVEGTLDEVLNEIKKNPRETLTEIVLTESAEKVPELVSEFCDRFHVDYTFGIGELFVDPTGPTIEDLQKMDDLSLFEEFYKVQKHELMSDEEKEYMKDVFERAKRGEIE